MLTNLKIEHLKPESKTKRYADRDGLTLEVRPCGSKVFRFRFQWEKKPQTITIGHFPATSLAQARSAATQYRAEINNGIDPRKADCNQEQNLKKNLDS